MPQNIYNKPCPFMVGIGNYVINSDLATIAIQQRLCASFEWAAFHIGCLAFLIEMVTKCHSKEFY